MRILALGGTRFVGRHIVEAARAAGHEVTVFNRGRSPLPGDDVEHAHRRPRDGRPRCSRRARRGTPASTSAPTCRSTPAPPRSCSPTTSQRYVFISTASVYVVESPRAWTRTTPLLPPALDEADAGGAELYGARKVACEQEIERVFPGRALIIRPGIVAGPFDPTNRFTWWVERLARAGEVLGPGAPESPVQLVDGRDLGAFTVAMTERQATGAFNACGPPSSFGELIDACRIGTGTSPRSRG